MRFWQGLCAVSERVRYAQIVKSLGIKNPIKVETIQARLFPVYFDKYVLTAAHVNV